MLKLQNLQKTYTMGENVVYALKDINLSIEEGDYVAIMGPSGSGKSTLMHILGLLDIPTSGSYKINETEVSLFEEDELAVLRREKIGFIFQQFNLLPRMSAFENVILPILYSKEIDGETYAISLLERMGITERRTHRPNELSGGQQQRVAIARSLINKPQMLLADEPTGNLDSVSEKEILKILKELNDQGITVIIVTHEEEVGLQAKRLIRMRDGVIQSDERLKENIKTNHKTHNPTYNKQSFLGDIKDYLTQGLKTLLANKVRTALSMLGIMIGVAAVIAILAIGEGAKKQISDQMSSLGSNLLVLRTGVVRVAGVVQESGSNTRLSIEDAYYLDNQIDLIKYTSANLMGRGQATYLNKNTNTQVIGGSVTYAPIHAVEPEIGRFFTEEENTKRARVAVIGTTVVRDLFGNVNPIGEMIRINKVNFQIIGILPEKGANTFKDQDDLIVIPVLTAMHRLFGRAYIDNIELQITDNSQMKIAEEQILDLIYKRHRIIQDPEKNYFEIRNMADIQASIKETSNTLAILLSSIAAISLLVGGIGIMNIMLVSVTERTREIGLRKAIGAKRWDILAQFLTESVVISAVGGMAGILLGVGVSFLVSSLSTWQSIVSLSSVIVSFVFSASIGIVFGIYPARKASLLHPIDALRHE